LLKIKEASQWLTVMRKTATVRILPARGMASAVFASIFTGRREARYSVCGIKSKGEESKRLPATAVFFVGPGLL
jgi:hypothetical protein